MNKEYMQELVNFILENKATHHTLVNGDIILKDYIEVDKLLDKIEEMEK